MIYSDTIFYPANLLSINKCNGTLYENYMTNYFIKINDSSQFFLHIFHKTTCIDILWKNIYFSKKKKNSISSF